MSGGGYAGLGEVVTIWDWADRHWLLVGFFGVWLALGTYEVLSGLGSYLSRRK